MRGVRTNTGANLNQKWKVGAQHALYRKTGIFYMPLEHFPGAYFDANGYVIFETEEEYKKCQYLRIGKRVDVPEGISKIPNYVKVNAVSLTSGLVSQGEPLLFHPVPSSEFSARANGFSCLNEQGSYFFDNCADFFQGSIKKKNDRVFHF